MSYLIKSVAFIIIMIATQSITAQIDSCNVVVGGSSVHGSDNVPSHEIESGTLSIGDSICLQAITTDSISLVVKGYNKQISGDTTRWSNSIIIFGSDTIVKDFMSNMPLEFFLDLNLGRYVLRFWKEFDEAGYGGLLDAAISFDCLPVIPPPCDSIVYVSVSSHVDTSICWERTMYDTLIINFCGDSLLGSGIDSIMLSNTITLSDIPNDTTVACLDDCPDVSTVVSARSSCSNFVSLSFERMIVDSNNCDGLIWHIWTATDGNIVIADTQKVWIKNNIPPVLIDAPDDLSLSCEDQIPGISNIVAVDNCGMILDVRSVRSLLYPRECDQIVQTDYTAADACGNMIKMRHNIYLVDTVGPVLSHNATDTIYTDPSNFVFEWNDICSVVTMSDTSTVIKNDSICIFYLTASDACGNISTDSIVYKKTVKKEEVDPQVDEFLKCSFHFSPNPFGNEPVDITWGGIDEDIDDGFLEIWSMRGQLIFQQEVTTESFRITVDLSDQPSGVYYARLRVPKKGFRMCKAIKIVE